MDSDVASFANGETEGLISHPFLQEKGCPVDGSVSISYMTSHVLVITDYGQLLYHVSAFEFLFHILLFGYKDPLMMTLFSLFSWSSSLNQPTKTEILKSFDSDMRMNPTNQVNGMKWTTLITTFFSVIVNVGPLMSSIHPACWLGDFWPLLFLENFPEKSHFYILLPFRSSNPIFVPGYTVSGLMGSFLVAADGADWQNRV